MAGRKHRREPEVVRPTPRRRAIELGKDLLILLLALSSFHLLQQTPLVTQFQTKGPTQSTTGSTQNTSESGDLLTPIALAVRNDRGLYAVAYDPAPISKTFSQVSTYLGKALTSASGVEEITQEAWAQLRGQNGIYCSFAGRLPLSVLSAGLGGSEIRLSSSAESLLLAWDGTSTVLAWRDGQVYHRASTSLSYSAGLEDALDRFNPNGAAFAQVLAARDAIYELLDPDVLITMNSLQPQEYTVTTPDFVNDEDALSRLLVALGFQSGTSSAYQSMGELAINENGDRLRVGPDGSVIFHAGGDTRYPVPSRTEIPSAAEAVQAAYPLLRQTLSPWKDAGSVVLSGVESSDENGWIISFQLLLDGIPAQVGRESWCAQFVTAGQEITAFSLSVRSYTEEDGSTALPPIRLAAAALRSLPESSGRLYLCYPDGSSGTLSAGWITEP